MNAARTPATRAFVLRALAAAFVLILIAASVFYWNPLWVHDQFTDFALWRHGVHSHYANVRNYRIHYLEAAPPDGSPGKPLLLIHGLGDHAEAWAAQIPTLAAAGFHVYAPDLIGYGRSERSIPPYSIQRESQMIAHFIETLQLASAPIDVAGWSMGGWIAAELTLDQPRLVDHLILEDSAGMRFSVAFPPDLFSPTDEAGLRRLVEMLSPRPDAMPHFVAQAALRKFAAQHDVIQSSMDSMESGADLLDNRLTTIHQPTLIVWGSEDRLLPIDTGLAMHREIPNSVMATITGCGHLAPAECAQPVLDVTIRFLKATPPMPRSEITLPGTTPPLTDRKEAAIP